VMAIAAITFLVWFLFGPEPAFTFALLNFVAVLIIACPCAMEAADLTLISGDVRGVARAIELSKATVRNIKQNLFWAFAYNVALIPVAVGVLYPFLGGYGLLNPVLAAAMALSSVTVVSNALRLHRAKIV